MGESFQHGVVGVENMDNFAGERHGAIKAREGRMGRYRSYVKIIMTQGERCLR